MKEIQPDSLLESWVEDYQLVRRIGSGPTGTVFLARHRDGQRQFVVKIMDPRIVPEEALIERFLQRFKTIRQLKHPAVVEWYDIGQLDSGHYYLIMEHLEGEPLSARMKRRKVRLGELAAWLDPVCDALHHAHSRKVIHRNLKPSNLFLTGDGDPKTCKLLDFSLAVFRPPRPGTEPKPDAMVLAQAPGTAVYLSPEQLLGEETKVGPHSDVYSLGVLLYRILTGQNPVAGDTVAELAAYHRQHGAIPLRDLNPGVPEILSEVVMHCLERDIDERYASPMEFHFEFQGACAGLSLEQCLDGTAIAARTTPVPELGKSDETPIVTKPESSKWTPRATGKPGGGGKPAAVEKSAVSKKPAAAEKPPTKWTPRATPRVPVPGKTAALEKPATVEKPAASEKPVASAKPATSEKPAASAKPAASVRPAASAKPAAVLEKPAASAKPAAPKLGHRVMKAPGKPATHATVPTSPPTLPSRQEPPFPKQEAGIPQGFSVPSPGEELDIPLDFSPSPPPPVPPPAPATVPAPAPPPPPPPPVPAASPLLPSTPAGTPGWRDRLRAVPLKLRLGAASLAGVLILGGLAIVLFNDPEKRDAPREDDRAGDPAPTPPSETATAEAKPADPPPVEMKPAEAKPAELPPADPPPAPTPPSETATAEAKPAEPKPAEPKPTSARKIPTEPKPAPATKKKPTVTKPATPMKGMKSTTKELGDDIL